MTSVPRDRVGLAYAGIVGGAPVQGVDWANGVALLNWLVGQGRALVPCFRPEHPGIPQIDGVRPLAVSYPVWLDFSYPTIDWIAFARIRASSATLPIRASDSVDVVLPTTPASRRTAYALGGVAGPLVVTGPSASAYEVEMIGAYEVPRVAIETTLDAGGATGLETISGRPILWETALEQMRDQCQRTRHGRRVLWQQSTAFAPGLAAGAFSLSIASGFAVGVTSSTFVDVTAGVPSLARKLTASSTHPCRGRAYAFHSGTATGEIRFVSAAGNGTAQATTAGGAWTGESQVDVRCEDESDAAGIPGAGLDFVRVQARRVSGGGTVYVAASTLYEAST